uniref:P-II family nitrogen regulator n=1 Tax=uncultured Marinobacter sp. TaxID=187379 RepID=UPI0030DD5273|tara:strand:- start:674 stop:994 length:321 start_codon:yes stop_codon:yes gene_type:complete
MNTNFCKVTAIFSSLDLKKVEEALIEAGFSAMTVSRTHGRGRFKNYYAKDTMADSVRVEVFVKAEQADNVVNTIARTVHKGLDSDGIIAVLPVEDLLHIRDFKEAE